MKTFLAPLAGMVVGFGVYAALTLAGNIGPREYGHLTPNWSQCERIWFDPTAPLIERGQSVDRPVYLPSLQDLSSPVEHASVGLMVETSRDGFGFKPFSGAWSEMTPGCYRFTFAKQDTDCDVCVFRVQYPGALTRMFYIMTVPPVRL